MNLIKLSSLVLAGLFLFGSAYAIQDKEPPKPAETPKEAPKETPKDKPADTVAELGKPAPDFTLTDMNGKTVKLADYKGKIVVLEWFQPSCTTAWPATSPVATALPPARSSPRKASSGC
ncbi:MAG: redoxin domain-containing protein [Planctomycetia bacterium]